MTRPALEIDLVLPSLPLDFDAVLAIINSEDVQADCDPNRGEQAGIVEVDACGGENSGPDGNWYHYCDDSPGSPSLLIVSFRIRNWVCSMGQPTLLSNL